MKKALIIAVAVIVVIGLAARGSKTKNDRSLDSKSSAISERSDNQGTAKENTGNTKTAENATNKPATSEAEKYSQVRICV